MDNFLQKILKSTINQINILEGTLWIFDILDGNFTNPCLTRARYILTYWIVERRYGRSGRECRGWRNGGEREREKDSELEREGGMAARERGKKARG